MRGCRWDFAAGHASKATAGRSGGTFRGLLAPQGAGNKGPLWSWEGNGEATDGASEVYDTGLLKICHFL